MHNLALNDLSPRARTLLDQALHGESAAIKARVLQLVLESGINPEEEFFLICLGLNHLKVLLLDAPTQLQSWATDLQDDLKSWAASYDQTLHAIAQKAEATSALTETAGQLSTLLTSHTQSCNALIKQLQISYQQWGDSWEQQATVNTEVQTTLQALSEALTTETARLSDQLQHLTAEIQASNKPSPLASLGLSSDRGWKSAVFYGTAFCLTLGALSTMLLATFYIRDRVLLHTTALKVEYLLQKQNRRDCLERIKAADSVECQR